MHRIMLALFTVAFLSAFWLVRGAERRATQPVTLLLTEVFYNTPGDDSREEWLEIANLGPAAVDLSDFKVGDEEKAGGREGMRRFPAEARIEPGQVIVVAQTAAGYRALFPGAAGFPGPDYEIADSDPDVPDMRGFPLWAGGDLALNNDGDEVLLLDGRNRIVDAINYGDSDTYFRPTIASVGRGMSIERAPSDCDTDSAGDWRPQTSPTPGVLVLEGECEAAQEAAQDAAVEELFLPIGAIQGDGPSSPYVNQMVVFRGVVTGAMEDQNARGIRFYSLFVQDVPGFEDGDPATSDGIALFLGRQRPSVERGDKVRVSGQVTEFYGFTEIDDEGLEIVLEDGGASRPVAVPLELPGDGRQNGPDLEPFEGMWVTVPGVVPVIGPTHSGCGFTVAFPGSGVERVFQRSGRDPESQVLQLLHHSDVNCRDFPDVKVGDRVVGIAGPLTFHFNEYKIVQQDSNVLQITSTANPPLPAPPPLAPGKVSVATFNLENYFDAIDDTGEDAEPKPSAAEIDAKQAKLAFAVSKTLGCPTVIGVQEVEKESLLLDLAAVVAEECGFTYQVTHRESPDHRGIDVALLTDPRRAAVIEARLRQGCTSLETGIGDDGVQCPPGQSPLFSRPPLEVRVELDGIRFIFLVNHFKSKRGGEAATAPRRLAQARHINEQVGRLLAEGETRVVVMGDFNDYEQSAPLLAMTSGGGELTDVLARIPEAERYSFVFGGVSQLIDGILVSPALAEEVADVTITHVNADFPARLSLDTSRAGLPYRSSDHDIPMLILAVSGSVPDPTVTSTPAPTPTVRPTAAAELPSSPGPKQEGVEGLDVFAVVAVIAAVAVAAWLWVDHKVHKK
ncbi:MAG: lamin tail domain-containing protein [Anaerolineae bacterium]